MKFRRNSWSQGNAARALPGSREGAGQAIITLVNGERREEGLQ